MNRAQRDATRERVRNASRSSLVAAVTAVLDVDADAQRSTVDDPQDEKLGWFSDGTDTAAHRVWDVVSGGETLTEGGGR